MDENKILIPWWLVLLTAISAIITGVLLFIRPAATLIILIQFLGIYWLVSGIFTLVSLIWDRTGWGWKFFNGILGIIAGGLIVQNLLWSTLIVPVTLAFILGLVGIMIGISQLFSAFRGGGWAIGILGAFSILLGLALIARPVIAALATPWVLGFLLVFGGIVALFGAFSLRRLEKESKAISTGKPAEPLKPSSPEMKPTEVPKAEPSVSTVACCGAVSCAIGMEHGSRSGQGKSTFLSVISYQMILRNSEIKIS
jgi:uncharacterized membrane protein HdeD (DUF308 family)